VRGATAASGRRSRNGCVKPRLRLHLKRTHVADRAAVNLAAGEPLYRYRQITMSRLSLVGRDWLAYLRRPNEAASTA
jgi:hypothetical protein